MPIKHQSDSYRNRKGDRYVCWDDVIEGDLRANARKVVQNFRAKGVRAFAEHNDDEGYSSVFVHEQDAIKHGFLSVSSSLV